MVKINGINKLVTPKAPKTTGNWQNFELHQARKTTKKAQKAANEKEFRRICAEAVKADFVFYTKNGTLPQNFNKPFYDFSCGNEIIQAPSVKYRTIMLFKNK